VYAYEIKKPYLRIFGLYIRYLSFLFESSAKSQACRYETPGGYSQKNWVGCAVRFPKPLPYL